jgi:hypothetical protein
MGKKVAKSTRKFAQSGQLKKTIEARRKHQQVKKKFDRRRGAKGAGKNGPEHQGEDEDEEEPVRYVGDALGYYTRAHVGIGRKGRLQMILSLWMRTRMTKYVLIFCILQ